MLRTSIGVATAALADIGYAWADVAPVATTTTAAGKVRGLGAGGVQSR